MGIMQATVLAVWYAFGAIFSLPPFARLLNLIDMEETQ
jgi:hypothetical protein